MEFFPHSTGESFAEGQSKSLVPTSSKLSNDWRTQTSTRENLPGGLELGWGVGIEAFQDLMDTLQLGSGPRIPKAHGGKAPGKKKNSGVVLCAGLRVVFCLGGKRKKPRAVHCVLLVVLGRNRKPKGCQEVTPVIDIMVTSGAEAFWACYGPIGLSKAGAFCSCQAGSSRQTRHGC